MGATCCSIDENAIPNESHTELNQTQQDEKSQNMLLINLDDVLAKFYENRGRNDYYNDSNKGKLMQFIENNKLNDDILQAQLGKDSDYISCSLTNIDNNFPLMKQTEVETNQKEEIFKILQYCYKYNKPPPISSQEVNS